MDYYTDIPAGSHTPGRDRPLMTTNTNSINSIIAIDHYTFGTGSDGKHKQITFAGENAAGAQTDPASAAYTAPGTASSVADLRFRNQNGVFPLSCIRAFGTCANTGVGAVVPTNSFNVASCTTGGGNLNVTLTAGAVTGTSYIVLATSQRQVGLPSGNDQIATVYSIDSATLFHITTVNVLTGTLANTTLISFIVLQA